MVQEKLLVKLQTAAPSEPQTRQSDVGLSGLQAGRHLSLLAPPLCPPGSPLGLLGSPLCPLGSPLGRQAAGELMCVLAAEGPWRRFRHRLQQCPQGAIGKIGRYGPMAASVHDTWL